MTALASRLLAEVRGAVARGWCAPANSMKVMDTDLAEAIAQEVCALMQAEAAAALSAPEGDMARAGARSGKGVTPPPGDGVVVPRALLEQVDSALMWDLHRRPYKHRVAQQKLIDLIREYAPAAPSAKGVA